MFGTNDPKVHHVVQALLRDDDVFLDIGANYSAIGLLAADRVGPQGHVHLFEPQPNLCHIVKNAITEGKLENVTLHNLMDCDGEMQLARPKRHSGMATLVNNIQQASWDTYSVQVKNIATYLPGLIKQKSLGVKIDVEGAEPVLMPWLLKQPTLKFLVFEAARNQKSLYQMIQESGFVLYGLEKTFFTKRLRRVDRFEEMPAYHDLVAARWASNNLPPRKVGSYAFGRMVRDAAGARP